MADTNLPSLLERHWAESALAIGAVLIAAMSLWVGYDTMRTNRELIAAASWPFIRVDDSDITSSGKPELKLSAVNAGIGPAKIESVELLWRGKAYATSPALLSACCGLPRDAAGRRAFNYVISTLDRSVVRAGQTVNLLNIPVTAQNQAITSRFHAVLYPHNPQNRLRLRICYCSAFNECWFTNGHRLNPPRVATCPVPKVPFEG